MINLDALTAVVREVRAILRPYLTDAELDAAVRSVMGAIIDVAMRRPVSKPEGSS